MATALKDWDNRIGRRLKLRDLHILSAVVQWGSMAKAAKHLSMTQPAVSDAIANLEDALSVRLLDRGSKGVEPTIYANVLLKRGLVVFDELRQGIRDIESLANPKAGEVRVGCPEALAAESCPQSLTDYRVDILALMSMWCMLKRRHSNFESCGSAMSISWWEEFSGRWTTT